MVKKLNVEDTVNDGGLCGDWRAESNTCHNNYEDGHKKVTKAAVGMMGDDESYDENTIDLSPSFYGLSLQPAQVIVVVSTTGFEELPQREVSISDRVSSPRWNWLHVDRLLRKLLLQL